MTFLFFFLPVQLCWCLFIAIRFLNERAAQEEEWFCPFLNPLDIVPKLMRNLLFFQALNAFSVCEKPLTAAPCRHFHLSTSFQGADAKTGPALTVVLQTEGILFPAFPFPHELHVVPLFFLPSLHGIIWFLMAAEGK